MLIHRAVFGITRKNEEAPRRVWWVAERLVALARTTDAEDIIIVMVEVGVWRLDFCYGATILHDVGMTWTLARIWIL